MATSRPLPLAIIIGGHVALVIAPGTGEYNTALVRQLSLPGVVIVTQSNAEEVTNSRRQLERSLGSQYATGQLNLFY